MAYLLITDKGLQGLRRADEGGFKLNVTEFAVSQEQNVSLAVEDSTLQGPEVFRAGIESIEAVGVSTVKVTLTIPGNYPATGSWTLREIGLFLETGELFAHGLLPNMEKSSEFGIKFYVLLTAGRLGEVINVTYTTTASVAATPHIRSLLSPNESRQNVVAVLDEQENDDGSSAASMAIKYGNGSLSWSFLGHKKQATDTPTTIFSQGSFVYEVESRGGFWLNDSEVVIVQVVSGPGAGESRKMRFSKDANTFTTVDKDFSAFSSKSTVSIWRDVANQLPLRTSNMPEHLVLGVGRNTWLPNVVSLTAGTLYPYRASTSVPGNTINTSSSIPTSAYNDTTKFMVFVDGKLLKANQYTAAGDTVVTTVSSTKSIDVIAFEFIQDTGSSLYFYEAPYDCNGLTSEFQLPMIPESASKTLVFVNGLLIPQSEYVINGSLIVFNNYAPTGRLVLVPFATYEELGSRSAMVRDVFTATGTEVDFTCTAVFALRKDTLMLVNGKYVEKDNYTVNSNRLILAKNFHLSASDVVEIFNFAASTESVLSEPSGQNTGPVWMDPAGVVGEPNILVPRTFTYHGDGANKTFDIVNTPGENYVWVFVGGVYQSPASFYFSQLAIRFEHAIPAGYPIDIICWQSQPHTGSQVKCKTTSVTLNKLQTVYTIGSISNVDGMIVSINGVYQHRETYVLTDPTTLTLSQANDNDVLEVWSFDWEAKLGYMTSINLDKKPLTIGTDYTLVKKVASTSDTLIFVGGAQLHKADRYTIDNTTGPSVLKLANKPYSYQQTLPLFILEMYSASPSSRLMTRDEVENYFMPLRGPHVSWDNLTDNLKSILACPIVKLLGLISGTVKADLNNPNLTTDDKSVVNKWGLSPVKMTVEENIIPVLNYAAIGSSVMLDLPVHFNFFDLLAQHIRNELGVTDFAIKDYEASKKYVIDDIQLSNVSFSAKSRADIPGAPLDTAWVLGAVVGAQSYANTTHPDKNGNFGPLCVLSTDCKWFIDIVGNNGVDMNSGDWAHVRADNNALSTVNVTSVDDSTYRTYTHIIRDTLYSGGDTTWTVKVSRLLLITDHNSQFLTMIDDGGAPVYVQLFARIYASLKYNDHDIRQVIYCMNRQVISWISRHNGNPSLSSEAYHWVTFSIACRDGSISGPGTQYPATASYTVGLAYGVRVYNADYKTGDATVVVELTSGSISYSQFGVDLMLNSVKLPTAYTVYPGMHVNPDGTYDPVLSNDDIFKSCCWTPIVATTKPNCASETPPLPPDQLPAPRVQISPQSLATTDHMYVVVSNVNANAVISWEISDTPNQVNVVGSADNTGYFSYTTIPGGAPRAVTFKVYVDGVYLDTVSVTVTASGGTSSHGTVEFVTNGSFTVPGGVYMLNVEMLGAGAGGGGGDYTYGGTGGARGQYVTSSVQVIPGEVLDVTIGVGGQAGLGCINNPTSANNGTSGTNSVIKRQNGTAVLTANGGTAGLAAGHFGSGTNGQASEMGLGGPGGNAGNPTYDVVTGALSNYAQPGSGYNAGGYGAGGGGGGASARPIADAIPGASGGLGSKGWIRISY